MSDKLGNGVVMFCYNNDQLDYTKFAIIAARHVKRNMPGIPVSLITDDGTKGWMYESQDEKLIEDAFDSFVIANIEYESNPRRHHDSPWHEFNAQFTNTNKHDVINLTPYKRTLLIDTDYLICNDYLKYLFTSDIPIGLHRYAQYIGNEIPYRNEITLNDAGINHWWSTVVYFDQSDESKLFFNIWNHVKDNWEYYSLLYQFPKALFRTDFCVSIACHMMSGLNNDETFIHDFGSVGLLNMDQKDDLVAVNKLNDYVFLKHNRKEQWKNILCRYENTNLHLMNKRAMDRNYQELLKVTEVQSD